MNQRILTQHPDPGKQGTNIAQENYDLICQPILESAHFTGKPEGTRQ
jgi:hypothetical protein